MFLDSHPFSSSFVTLLSSQVASNRSHLGSLGWFVRYDCCFCWVQIGLAQYRDCWALIRERSLGRWGLSWDDGSCGERFCSLGLFSFESHSVSSFWIEKQNRKREIGRVDFRFWWETTGQLNLWGLFTSRGGREHERLVLSKEAKETEQGNQQKNKRKQRREKMWKDWNMSHSKLSIQRAISFFALVV